MESNGQCIGIAVVALTDPLCLHDDRYHADQNARYHSELIIVPDVKVEPAPTRKMRVIASGRM